MNNRVNFSWLIKMAWRDSRRNFSRLLLFISSIILGIAALVAIYSLGDNVRRDVDQQAATLIGADLQVSTNKPVEPAMQQLLDSIGQERSEEQYFASMVMFTKNQGTRLVQVRALQGPFPYYGQLETVPQNAGKAFKNKQAALVDNTLMLQYDAQPGDSIKVGAVTFEIAGTLMKAPGQTGLSSSIAPVVYIPLQYLEQTGLSQKGSRINYRFYYKLDKTVNVQQLVQQLEPKLDKEGYNVETIETQKESSGRSFNDLNNFLSLVGFIALLLGCVGVASSIHIYIKEKISTIAILRCLGTQSKQAFLIYLIQIVAIGCIGAVLGAALGTLILQFLPLVLKDLVAVTITTAISWRAIGQGILLGIFISLLFALLPLISLRKISPLNTLRVSVDENTATKDKAKWLVYLLILLFVLVFTYLQLGNWTRSIFFTIGVVVAFLFLVLVAMLMMWLVRKFFPSSWSYLWRQGLANLYRPNNQSVILIVSIGLGTAFICILLSVQGILLNRITLSASGNQPNMVLFDIQSQQQQQVLSLAQQHKLPVLQQVPIVNMRLQQINSRTSANYQDDSLSPRNIFAREYRVTYRDSLTASETVNKGKWTGTTGNSANIQISVEEGWAKRNNIAIGDTMVFNVQGAMIATTVGSLREVDWNRIQTNFLVVFPTGVLEEAPQFHVLLTRVENEQSSARFQQAVVRQFPNVSIIDLGLVLKTLDDILSKIGFVIKFMAGFSIITGLIVLIASVLISRYQRVKESVLLRTLGASRKQIIVITALEYFFLGALAAATGILLSLVGSWALAKYLFKTSFVVEPLPLVIVLFAISILTVIIGLMNSRSILNKPPLEVLRKET
ncbi:ABC transporter permease [Aridibaculum aurantiacum]|uniref:ABC transporter permease n=1 Tax=Aridibaculum aurantiacum TaxID=2810307 RepID=UPI001A96B78C|nr:FtsX-like permease family protein [Aridibaculum aurantiacum]